MNVRLARVVIGLACTIPAALPLAAQQPTAPHDSLADLDIEDLARIRVSTAVRFLPKPFSPPALTRGSPGARRAPQPRGVSEHDLTQHCCVFCICMAVESKQKA